MAKEKSEAELLEYLKKREATYRDYADISRDNMWRDIWESRAADFSEFQYILKYKDIP